MFIVKCSGSLHIFCFCFLFFSFISLFFFLYFFCILIFFRVPGCSGMFRNVPCSWFYQRPFISDPSSGRGKPIELSFHHETVLHQNFQFFLGCLIHENVNGSYFARTFLVKVCENKFSVTSKILSGLSQIEVESSVSVHDKSNSVTL